MHSIMREVKDLEIRVRKLAAGDANIDFFGSDAGIDPARNHVSHYKRHSRI
jgi:hypothetical protein